MIKKFKTWIVFQLVTFKGWVVFTYNSWWNTRHLKKMTKDADKKHELTGKQFFVVPASKTRLMVVDNSYVKAYNKMASKQKRPKITHPQLLEMCYYKTPSGTYGTNR